MRDELIQHQHRQEIIAGLLALGGLSRDEAASLMPRPQFEPRTTRDRSRTDPRFVAEIAGREDGIPRHLWHGLPLAMARLQREDLFMWKALRVKWGQGHVQSDKAVALACGRGVHWARRTLERGLDRLVGWLWTADGTHARFPTGEE